MLLFLDSANLDEAAETVETGVIGGITTNPSLISKEPKANFVEHCKRLAEICNGLPLSVEVFCKDASEMVEEAYRIYDEVGYSNLNIKIPIGFDELKVINKLSSRNIPVNCTCCFSESQMKLAIDAGSRYASLFYCRLKDCDGGDPDSVISEIRHYIDMNDFECEIIAGSIRTPENVMDAWASGSHIVTTSMKVIREMTEHEKTTESIERFLHDFQEWMK